MIFVSGCSNNEFFSYDPPPGWESDGKVWWKVGQDTTGLLRNLETLESMGVTGSDEVYLANANVNGGYDARQQFGKAVKRSLIRMYRNEPAIVDSLFETYLTPQIDDVKFTSDPAKDVEGFKKKSYKLLRRHFREPRTRLKLGTDVLVPYPDSLRSQGIHGSVILQVYLNDEGEPLTVEVVDKVHPVLDQLALVATTKMEWLPAYVERKRDWAPIPSWTRFRITFKTSEDG